MSFNNVLPGVVLSRLAQIKTERTIVHDTADAGPRVDPRGRETVLISGTYRHERDPKTDEVVSSHTNTFHIDFDAALMLHSRLGEAIETHRIYMGINRD